MKFLMMILALLSTTTMANSECFDYAGKTYCKGDTIVGTDSAGYYTTGRISSISRFHQNAPVLGVYLNGTSKYVPKKSIYNNTPGDCSITRTHFCVGDTIYIYKNDSVGNNPFKILAVPTDSAYHTLLVEDGRGHIYNSDTRVTNFITSERAREIRHQEELVEQKKQLEQQYQAELAEKQAQIEAQTQAHSRAQSKQQENRAWQSSGSFDNPMAMVKGSKGSTLILRCHQQTKKVETMLRVSQKNWRLSHYSEVVANEKLHSSFIVTSRNGNTTLNLRNWSTRPGTVLTSGQVIDIDLLEALKSGRTFSLELYAENESQALNIITEDFSLANSRNAIEHVEYNCL